MPARLRYGSRSRWPRSSSSRTSSQPSTHRAQWFTNSLNYYLAVAVLQRIPASAARGGTLATRCATSARCSARVLGLIFPEGQRTQAGEINEFRAGNRHDRRPARRAYRARPVARARTRCCIRNARMARRARVTVSFGAPLVLRGDDYTALAREVEDAVRTSEGQAFVSGATSSAKPRTRILLADTRPLLRMPRRRSARRRCSRNRRSLARAAWCGTMLA